MNLDQQLYNIALGIAAFLGGWWMKVMWETLKDLQNTDRALADKVASIEVLVAGTYVKRDDFERIVDALFRKLDKIDDKLDGKVDKS